MKINLEKNPRRGWVSLCFGIVIFWSIQFFGPDWAIFASIPFVTAWAYATASWFTEKKSDEKENTGEE